MMTKAFNPGSLPIRLGSCLQDYEDARKRQDLAGCSDAVENIADYLSVFLAPDEWQSYEKLPGYRLGDTRTWSEVYRDVRARLRYLLAIARENNAFTKAAEPYGDASSLDDEETVVA